MFEEDLKLIVDIKGNIDLHCERINQQADIRHEASLKLFDQQHRQNVALKDNLAFATMKLNELTEAVTHLKWLVEEKKD